MIVLIDETGEIGVGVEVVARVCIEAHVFFVIGGVSMGVEKVDRIAGDFDIKDGAVDVLIFVFVCACAFSFVFVFVFVFGEAVVEEIGVVR